MCICVCIYIYASGASGVPEGVASKRSSGAQSSSARDSSGTSMFPILEASSPNAEVWLSLNTQGRKHTIMTHL
eukprot:731111-Amphidinium_carterae.2